VRPGGPPAAVKVWVLSVGRPGPLLAGAIAEYERRAARYWSLAVAQVRAERGSRGATAEDVRDIEAARLLARLPAGAEVVALTRAGESWTSLRLARLLAAPATGRAGVAFLIGGAHGLGASVLRRADRRMRLSSLTLPHDAARLVLAEQIYRAGTILRGEPYHKGGEDE
jgi:23S rRNA (pseudouridine1915-N3)-methyltransferase